MIDLLDRAAAAIREGRPDEALALMTRFERRVTARPPHPAQAEAMRQGLARLSGLIRAAQQGVVDARNTLEDINRMVSQVRFYDGRGVTETVSVRAPKQSLY